MRGFKKKLLALLLVTMMLVEQLPVTRVYAEDVSPTEDPTVETMNEDEEGEVNTGAEFSAKETEAGDDSDDEGSQEDAKLNVDYVDHDDVKALSIQGTAAFSVANAAQAIMENTDLSEDEALEIAEELFATRDGDTPTDPNVPPREGDDSQIESISVKWITADTVDNGDASLLYIKPEGSEEMSVRLQINYALSGEHDYEAGDITITIPAHIFKKRPKEDGTVENAGTTIIPFPEAPSTKNDFNWNLVGDNYVLTNTKHMMAATKGYIQIGFSDLLPYELVDMAESEPFDAYIQVTTHLGNTIALRTEEKLTAQFDTEAKITALNKRAYQAVSIIPASQIPEEQRIDGVEKYVKVDWYLWGKIKANTEYRLEARDFIYEGDDIDNVQYNGFIINATGKNGHEAIKVISKSHSDGNTSYITFSTAYPLTEQFELNKTYTFKNKVEMTVTEIDPEAAGNPNVQNPDPKLTTSMTVSATKNWVYRNPKWIEPKGHFNVFKNGNDGKLKSNVTHHVKDSKHKYDSYNDRFLADDAFYGIYGNALNKLRDDEDYDLSYTVNSIGYIMPWTYRKVVDGPDAATTVRMIENWFNRPVRMITADDSVNIERSIDEDTVQLTPLVDYEFVSIEFLEPRIYTGVPKNINPDGSWHADTYDDGTFEYTLDRNKANYPDIDLEVLINDTWEHYATASWKSGSLKITLADGSVQTDSVVKLPNDVTKNWRTIVIFNNAAIEYDVRPVIRIKSTDAIKERIIAEFESTDTPVLNFWNSVTMDADEWDPSREYDPRQWNVEAVEDVDLITPEKPWARIVTFPNDESPYKDGYDRAHGYTTDTKVYPTKTSQQKLSDVNYTSKMITIHYSAKVEIRSTISDKTTYEQAIADKQLQTTTHGVWRDLLPKGVTPITDTIKLRAKDSVTNYYTIENYRNSGRTLLVVEADLKPVTATYKQGDMTYYEDAPTISFDALYAFDSLSDYGDYIHNVISFESNNEQFGTIEGYTGEADDPFEHETGNPDKPYETYNVTTGDAFAPLSREKEWMTDLNPDHDNRSFVYAGSYTKLDLISAARTSLNKEVSVNNDGIYSSGVWYGDREENERVVYTGGQYSYQIRMMADDETITSNIRIYDSLENFYAGEGNDPVDIATETNPVYRWQGVLRSIDVTQLVDKGCDPIVYYSLVSNLQLADETDPKEAHPTNVNLNDTSIWIKAEDYEGSLSAVKAIAVDATYSNRETGELFDLNPLDSIVIIVNMLAPSGEAAAEYIEQEAHAYNNAYMLCKTTDVDTGESDDSNFVRKDYTKVGLKPYNFDVEKKWIDDANRDGIRPTEIIVHLYANDVDTGLELVLDESNDWKGTFENIPYSDINGKIHYSVREEVIRGYDETDKYLSDNSVEITNRHDPEKINLSGTKTWVNDNSTVRPHYIIVSLYGNDKLVKKIEVQADENGNWTYTFNDMYKYENGKEIEYRVTEEIKATVGKSYVVSYNGLDIINTYHPYGDLLLHKYIDNTTDVSKETEFGFTFVFTRTVEGETEPEPVTASYQYDVLDENGNVIDGRSGTVSSYETVYIKGNETLHVKEIDAYVKYTITEEKADGFVIVSSKNLSGTIVPNSTVEASVTNRYSATGKVELNAVKKLYNKTLKRSKFSFDVYQITKDEDGSEVKTLVKQAPNESVKNVVYREDGTVDYSDADVFFGAITYTEADVGNTYTYYVEETVKDMDGYEFSTVIYRVTVEIEDNGDGTLNVTKTYYDGDTSVETMLFENIYSAEGSLVLYAWKELKGRELKEEEFTFELYDESGSLIETKTNDENGTVAFTEIKYTEKDIGKTFYYVIHETKGSDETVIYTDAYYAYKVEIQDYDNGQLNIIESLVLVEVTVDDDGNLQFEFPVEAKLDENGAIVYDDDDNIVYVNKEGELPVFVNTLEPGSLSITKKISDESEEYDPDQEFVFHVKLIGEDVEEDAVYEYTIVKAGSQGNGGSGDTGEGNGSESGTGNENGTGDGTGSGGDSQPLLANPFPLIVRNGFNGPLKEGDSEEEKAYAIQSGQYFIFFTSKTVPTSPVTLTVDGVTKDYSGTIYSDFLSSKTWGNLTGVKYVDVDDNSVIKPTSMSSWFQRWSGLVSVDLTGFKTESPIALDSLFSLCSNLKTVTFDEKLKVSSTYNMFYACYGLVSLDLSTLNTTAITNMDSMFKSCRLLESIKFGDKFSTDNVVTMASMFNDCQKLKTLDLSSFNTASVESMESMFYWCFALESIKFGKNFNTAKVEKMSQMFDTCSSLKSLDLSGFSTASISGTNMTSMFRSCTSLETVVFGNEFTVENVTDLSSLFGGCSSLKTLDLTTFKTANVTNMGLMFSSCSSLKSLTLGTYFNTENVMYMASMFSGCSSLETLDLSVFKTPKVRETAGMFRDCSSLKTLDIRNFSITAYMMNMNNMFAGCNALSSISLGSDFSFKPPYYEGRYAILPTPTASGCTGKWINTDTLIAKTAEELKDEYGNDTITWAGTWIWERNAAYTIHFTVAEEDLPVAGLMSDVTTDFDVECKLPANEFQKDKYRFVNWIEASVINSSGTEVGQQREYTDRATIPVNTYNIGDKVTLQAVFAHNTVSVKDGEFEIILHGDETAIIDGLPAGTSYQIWEETPDGWILIEEKNSSGKIIEMETQEAEFTNLYQPKMTAVRFHGTKMLDNTVAEAGKYTFELYEVVDGKRVLLETVETMNGGFIQFKRIDYTKDDVGTHTYIIKETGFTDDSIEYDTHEETVTVVVSESEDMLISRVTYDDDGISFINKKRPGALRLTKIGEGVNEANEDDEFTFKITFRNESGMPIDDKIYWYIENEDGTIEVPTETGTSGGAGGEALPLLSNPLPLGLLKNGIGPMKEDDDDEVSTWFHATSDMLEGTAYAIYTSNRELIFFRSKGTYSNGANTTVTDIKGNTYSGTVYTGIETNSRNGAFNTNVRSVRIADGQAIKPKDTRYWFYNCSNLTSVDLSRLDTSIDTTFQALFYGCTSLRSIDVSTWDTRKIETMDMMFRDCSSLESLDLSSFRTPNLRVLRWTFIFCRNLKSLDLSSFDTSKVVSFQSCFEGLTSLKSLDISNFDVSGAVQGNNYGSISASLYGVFKNSSALEYLDISGMTITNKSASMSDFFLSTRAISTIVLGPGYKFTGASNTNLPTPPSSSPYTGEWIRIDGAYGPCTPEILASKYKSEMAGTWVWQTDDTGSIVYFNAEGGYCSPTSTRAEFMNKKITMPDYPDVQKPGYTIGGWNTKEDGSGTSYDPGKTYTYSQIGTKIGETIVLYAQWNKGDNWKYTVRHYKEKLDGSDFDLAATEVKYAKAVPSEDDPDQLVAIVTPPVKTEYAAEGFYLPDPQTVSVNKNGTTFIDYYYSRGTYEIIFDGNGATSGGMENLKMNSGVAKNLPLNTYQMEGSIFIGWNTKADGTGDAYTDGQQVKNLTKEETITLYAQWLKNENDPLTPTFGVVYVTLKAGQMIVIPNLPNGTSYTIEETEIPDGWTLKKIEGAEGVIVSNHNAEAFATNTYKAKGEAYIVAHKKLIDGEIEEGQFSFELLDEDGEVLQTKSNGAIDENQYVYDENGNQIENPYYGYAVVYFDPISYDTTGTYTYTVQEVPGEDKNIEYDKNTFGVTVNVENGGNGRLDCEVIYKDENEPMFVNRYMPGSLKIYKEIVSGDDNQKFSFVVHLYDKDGEELEDKFIATIASEGGRSYDEEYKSGDTISMTPKETVEISSIPAGTTYTVEEVEIPKNWELVSSEDTAGTIVSNETAKIRFTNKHTVVLFGDLVIEKELDTWEDGSPVTFIFDVVVEKNGEIILADVYSLTYDGPGKKRIEIKDLPSEANVTVKEIYVGAGYKLSTDATVNVVIDPDRPENLASFTNTYDNKRKRGYGAQNTFTTEDGETWTWISDLEEGGEGHE